MLSSARVPAYVHFANVLENKLRQQTASCFASPFGACSYVRTLTAFDIIYSYICIKAM
jgi:hypothetical protein